MILLLFLFVSCEEIPTEVRYEKKDKFSIITAFSDDWFWEPSLALNRKSTDLYNELTGVDFKELTEEKFNKIVRESSDYRFLVFSAYMFQLKSSDDYELFPRNGRWAIIHKKSSLVCKTTPMECSVMGGMIPTKMALNHIEKFKDLFVGKNLVKFCNEVKSGSKLYEEIDNTIVIDNYLAKHLKDFDQYCNSIRKAIKESETILLKN